MSALNPGGPTLSFESIRLYFDAAPAVRRL